MNEGRPVPLHGRAAEVLVDFGIWRRHALADPTTPGVVDVGEAMRAVPMLLELAPLAGAMAVSLETIGTIAGSRDGVEGHRALRLFAHILRRRREQPPMAPRTIVETEPRSAA